jgi:hypothetical protein
METETPPASQARRPRTWLLVMFGVVVAAALMMKLGGSAGPAPQTSNPPARPAAQAGEKPLSPTELDVRLEDLEAKLPGPDDTGRNPFRFQPKAPPPAPVQPPTPKPTVEPPGPIGPPPPPPTPPITLKFIGVTEAPGIGKIAALTDCKLTEQGREGETVYGRYRIVKIGVESLTIEYTDGKGRTTLRMSGQDCIGR